MAVLPWASGHHYNSIKTKIINGGAEEPSSGTSGAVVGAGAELNPKR
jgi:hypothetical protein